MWASEGIMLSSALGADKVRHTDLNTSGRPRRHFRDCSWTTFRRLQSPASSATVIPMRCELLTTSRMRFSVTPAAPHVVRREPSAVPGTSEGRSGGIERRRVLAAVRPRTRGHPRGWRRLLLTNRLVAGHLSSASVLHERGPTAHRSMFPLLGPLCKGEGTSHRPRNLLKRSRAHTGRQV